MQSAASKITNPMRGHSRLHVKNIAGEGRLSELYPFLMTSPPLGTHRSSVGRLDSVSIAGVVSCALTRRKPVQVTYAYLPCYSRCTLLCRRGAIAHWTAKNRKADLHVRDRNSSCRRATQRRPALQDDHPVSQPNRSTVNARDCLPVLDKALCMLTGLPELLLDHVIVGRYRREHESKKSKKRNQPRQGKATERTPIARGTRSASAHIALSHAIHHSN